MYGGGVRTHRSVWQWIDESESKGAFGCQYIDEPGSEDVTSAYLVTCTGV